MNGPTINSRSTLELATRRQSATIGWGKSSQSNGSSNKNRKRWFASNEPHWAGRNVILLQSDLVWHTPAPIPMPISSPGASYLRFVCVIFEKQFRVWNICVQNKQNVKYYVYAVCGVLAMPQKAQSVFLPATRCYLQCDLNNNCRLAKEINWKPSMNELNAWPWDVKWHWVWREGVLFVFILYLFFIYLTF